MPPRPLRPRLPAPPLNRRLSRSPASQLLGRAELPIVTRTSTTWPPKPLILFLGVVIAFIAYGHSSVSPPEFSAPFSVLKNIGAPLTQDSFQVSRLVLTAKTLGMRATWDIKGEVKNTSGQKRQGPLLMIRLNRPDGTIAAQGVLDLRQQIIADDEVKSFAYQLQTDAGESVSVSVKPVPGPSGEGDSGHD
jgi:hypothetical protein